jgi:uracil phosphoribosyltransferase
MNNYIVKYIKRTSNNKRKFGFIIDGYGKNTNVDIFLYNKFSKFIDKKIINKENIIFFGLAESGIFLSKYVYESLDYKSKKYICSTRHNNYKEDNENKYIFSFNENHCLFNSNHKFYFNYDNNINYDTFVILEDEITSGNTIISLISKIYRYFKNIYIFTLIDNREKENIICLFKDINIKIYSLNLELIELENSCNYLTKYNINNNLNINNIIFTIGEASNKLFDNENINLDNNENSIIRFISSTKYDIDNINIFNFIEFNQDNISYYYYNTFNIGTKSNIIIYYYSNDIFIYNQLCDYLINNYTILNIIKKEYIFSIFND